MDKVKTLLVEDDPNTATMVGYAIPGLEVAASLEDARHKASFGVDVVILDLNLPDSAGLETFRTFHAEFPDIPVIIFTAHDDSIAWQAIREGASEFLSKSKVDQHQQIRLAVKLAVERHGINKELQGIVDNIKLE